MPVTYSFTTELGDILTRAPLGAAYLDDVRQDDSTTTPIIVNRIPPPRIQAQIECSNAETYTFAVGDSMVVYCPTHAQRKSGAEPFNINNGDTLTLRIDDGYLQEVVFSGLTDGAATAEEVARSIALQIRQASAILTDSETTVTISATSTGSSSQVGIEGGTAATALGFSLIPALGSDNGQSVTFIPDDDTAIEVASRINSAITHALAQATENDRVRLYTDEDKIYCTGTAAETLGFTPYGRVITSEAEPFSLRERDTLKLKVDNGVEQEIILKSSKIADISTASVEMLVELLNFKLLGATAEVSDDGTRLEIRSNTEARGSKIEITGGSAVPALGLTDAVGEGVGYGSSINYEAKATDSILFDVFDVGSGGLTDLSIYVKTDYIKTLIYDSSIAFTADGWTVSVTGEASPGSLNTDIYHVEMEHSVDFISDETVKVEVTASTAAPATQTYEYQFAVEDTRRPSILQLTSWTPRKLRIKFSEPMDRGTTPTSSLYLQDVSGRISYYATYGAYTNVVEAPTASFTTSDEGLFLGSAGAQNSDNNFVAEILTVLDSTLVIVDATLVDEEPVDPEEATPPLVTVCPYRVVRDVQDDPNKPTFIPIVESLTALESDEVPSGDEPARYIDIAFHDDLSPNSNYKLEAVTITDLAGNEIGSTYTFTSWSTRTVLNRSWSLPNLIPQHNWDQDTSGDLAKLINCFDEVAQVLLNDIDRFGDILDPWTAKDSVIDTMLADLGNPFAFVQSLTLSKKRSLVQLLVQIYKKKGIDSGIENTVAFFLGKTINVVPWTGNDDAWVIGESELGFNTYLDPSKSFIRYSFVIEHTDVLTDAEKAIINEIVEFSKPAHTHFIGYIKVLAFS